MDHLDEIAAHLGSGKVLHTRARGTKFRAHVAGGQLVVESERSGRKTFTRTQVETAATSVKAAAPPLDDRAAQVARSWVGAILDSMSGAPNPAKRSATSAPPARGASTRTRRRSPSGSSTRKTATTRPAVRPSTSGGRQRRFAKAAPATTRRREQPAPSAPSGPSPAEIAVTIGQEIARAIGQARVAPERTDDTAITQITDQLATLTAQIESLRAERDALVGERDAASERAAGLERTVKRWQAAAAKVGGVATAALAPNAAHDEGPIPADIADLLAQAARSWKSAPSGSISASRSALERSFRAVAGRVTGSETWAGASFAELRELLASRPGARGNLAPSDIFLARDLYQRSSKSSHGEDGWKPTPGEALLVWAGVAVIAQRAFGDGDR